MRHRLLLLALMITLTLAFAGLSPHTGGSAVMALGLGHPCPPDCPHHPVGPTSSDGDCTCRSAEAPPLTPGQVHLLPSSPNLLEPATPMATYRAGAPPDPNDAYPIPWHTPPRPNL